VITVSRNDERSRYEGRLDGVLVTVIDFVREGNVLEVTHTGTRIRYRGRGFASQVTQQALEDVRALGWQVQPRCPFTVAYLDAHPQYADLRV
jgi:predicted GNAT family acetyltransferase